MKNLVNDTIIKMRGKGEHTKDILLYWLPELISAMILITLPPIIDSLIVSNSQSLTSYGALAMASNFLYTLTKFAEAIPVASVAFIGRFNGAKEYEKSGESLSNTFWMTTMLGIIQFGIIMVAAESIYRWLGVPEEMVHIGAPYLRLRSFGILLTFMLFGFIFFMRSIKNTRIPMLLNIVGMSAFCFFDYALVLGKFGFPQLNLHGSAIATIIQYGIMNAIAMSYIMLNPDYKKYFPKAFFAVFKWRKAIEILNLSWPIMIDKSVFAMAYVWLSKMIAPLGTHAITAYDVVKNLERFAFLPAMAFAQVITFLVSNQLGAQDPDGASANIKKVLILCTLAVGTTLSVMCFNATYFVGFFDKHGQFTDFASSSLICISLFVIFDLVQVILAGALRGASDVRTVMWVRLLTCIFFFFPASYIVANLPIENTNLKFILIYATYYVTTGIIASCFWIRIKSHKWQKSKISVD